MNGASTERELELLFPRMVRWRRYLHQYPELSFQESETSRWIAAELEELGCTVQKGIGGHGLTVSIKGGKPGPVIALRADIDALPIQDEKQCDYASKVPNVMHACGHDGHTAALLAVAAYYMSCREELAGERRLLFQPAEEVTPGGAVRMIADGALEGVSAIFGVHLWTPLPYGQAASAAGPLMSAADDFFIEITGRGGHGGLPHESIDTIMIGVTLVQAIQTIVSRIVNPLHPAVVTIGSFQAGSAPNVIAETCQLKGTVRTFDENTRTMIHERLAALIDHICSMYGAAYTFDLKIGYPPVVNDPMEAERFFRIGGTVFGEAGLVQSDKITVAEDFAYYLQEVPGCFVFVGAGNLERGASYPHHHPKFDIDERAMLQASRLLIAMAENKAEELINEEQGNSINPN